MTLGERICAQRTAHHLSQTDLADTLGVSRQSVSKWETDASVPDLDKLVKMCELFETSLDQLVRGAEPTADLSQPTIVIQRENRCADHNRADFNRIWTALFYAGFFPQGMGAGRRIGIQCALLGVGLADTPV